MPRHPVDPNLELRRAISDGRAVIVVGTGMSIAASWDPESQSPHPQASWAGLLESGLEWLKEHKHIPEPKAAALLTLLRDEPDTYSLITTAQQVTHLMGGAESIHFENWLKETIGTIEPINRDALDALEALRDHGNLLATTNYDGLLLDDVGSRKPVTWKEPNEFIRAVRNKEADKVLFLHGYWRQPQSVILDWNSYEATSRNQQYREDLASIWKLTTWVYVGCGANGMSDPDFGLLLKRYGERARQADLWDFCLVRSSEREEFQAHFDKLKINVCAVPFGASHGDLPEYLRSLLPAPSSLPIPANEPASTRGEPDLIPTPPAFYAEPDYIGSHQFVGRARELEELGDWAKPADPANMLLYEAIGGNGKSMLTWEWTTKHATLVRDDWAGRFWYSFYERGAIMADFCQRALAYMTGQPLKELRSKKTTELVEPLLAQLRANPWLLILDGLERVLVAYHRIDAAEMPDEDANSPTDQIVDRNPCDAIRDEDNDLLRALAAATPSKILVSSRLTPRVLLNPSGQAIIGAKRITLPGLRPSDAERLLLSCGIGGDSATIQNYLTTNCDNHPLVIGILAGLINNYLPARGSFDDWAADGEGGAKLDLASLDLIQRRNHILRTALDALPTASRQLLSTLALLSESVDYEMLKAFNPHLPLMPKEVRKPMPPRFQANAPSEEKARRKMQYETALLRWQEVVQTWEASSEYSEATQKLGDTVLDLERRRLLQYDGRALRYDIHPVVRAVSIGGIPSGAKQRYGRRVLDYFSSRSLPPYRKAESLGDVIVGIHIVRTLLSMGRYKKAIEELRPGLSNCLTYRLEANAELLSLLRPIFPDGWGTLSGPLATGPLIDLAIVSTHALRQVGQVDAAIKAGNSMMPEVVGMKRGAAAARLLSSLASAYSMRNQLRKEEQCRLLSLKLANRIQREHFRLGYVYFLAKTGRLGDEDALDLLKIKHRGNKSLGRRHYAYFLFWNGKLNERILAKAEAGEDRPSRGFRDLLRLRSQWRLEQEDWPLAAASFAEAVRMARKRGISDAVSETGLALAKHHLGQLVGPHREAERLAQLRHPAHRFIAQLWLALGEPTKAKHHALTSYQWCWANGEPYVRRYELTKTTELLHQMKVPIPKLSPYDPAKDEPFPWEADVRAAIEKLRAEKEAKEKSK